MYWIWMIAAFMVGGAAAVLVMLAMNRATRAKRMEEMERETNVMKKNKMLEVKEKFLQLKAELEKQVAARNSKIQSVEAKLKQHEMSLTQRQEELQRKVEEVEIVKENLNNQTQLIEKRKLELEKMHQQEVVHLETISGLSAGEAKERLIESLKDEAKTNAAAYVNEIMEEAKMTANMEAKKMVIRTIQRVATETAIENSVTVFHIDSD